MAKELLATELAGIRKISIDSGGGEVESALLIADRIRLSGALLVIDRRCFSACASIILPAARRVRIRPGALIALHGTQTGLAKLFLRTKASDKHRLYQSPDVAQRAREEHELYVNSGVDPRLLLLPYTSRGRICYANARQPNGRSRFAIATERPAYFVDIATLAAFGLKVEGNVGTIRSDNRSDRTQPDSSLPAETERTFNALAVEPCNEQ